MSRRPRLHAPGGLYHVTMRGNNRGTLFFCDRDRQKFEAVIDHAREGLGVKVHSYCWMTNHIHLAIQVGEIPLGRFVQRFAATYAQYLNCRRQTSGHVFERRYHAVLVEIDSYLLQLVRYIHLNPVKARIAQDPIGYPWSSHRYYVLGGGPGWLETTLVLSVFGGPAKRARRAFSEFVSANADVEVPDEVICGSERDSRVSGEIPGVELETDSRSCRTNSSLEQLIDNYCARHGIQKESLAGPGRQRHLARVRAEIAREAVDQGAANLAEIGRRLGRSDVAIGRLLRRHAKNCRH